MDASDIPLNLDSPLAALVRRARRRHMFQVVADEAALALAIVFGGMVLLLILGTQILDWYWLAALFAVGLGFGAYRARKKFASRYAIARTLDRNLALNDALSTAVYFNENPSAGNWSEGVVERQWEMAEGLARSADLQRGLPLVFSRSVYASGMLALAAISVFGLRYGVTRKLDLRPSLVEIAFDGFLGQSPKIADARKKPSNDPRAKDWKNPGTLKYDPWEAQTMDQKGAPDSALNTIDTPNVDNSNNTGPTADPKANGQQSNNTPDSMAENQENSERSSGNPDQAPEGSQAPSKDGGKPGTPPPGSEQQKGQSAENSSLTDKMRDALSNLLSKLKMQPKSGANKSGGQQQNQNGGQQQSAQSRPNPNGSPMPGKPQQDATGSPDGQASQDAQGTEQAKAGQGKSSGKNEERSNSQDGKSGIGRQDGDKSLKEAEQLAAMGKISEIIGKRSQNVTGEVMVEVASGSQQLRTQYSQRKAAHADTGGEINRDEVPLAYQQYVQSYFEEIRKLPVAKSGKKAEGNQKKTGPS